jgi:hypothetical protein
MGATASGACGYGIALGHPVWLNRDPIGERGGINLYANVFNNPIDMYDPYGLSSCDDLVNELMGALEDYPNRENFGDHLYDQRYKYNMPDGSGFRERLIRGGQNGAVGRHVAAGAELTVSSRNLAGPIATRLQSARDLAEGIFTSKSWAESQAERADNSVSRRVGRAFLDYFDGNCEIKGDCAAKNAVRQRLMDLLCE